MTPSPLHRPRVAAAAVVFLAGMVWSGTAFAQTTQPTIVNQDTDQDFKSAQKTPYAGSTSGTGAPPSVQTPGPGGVGTNYLRLLQSTDLNVTNTATFDRSFAGGFTQIVADFDFRIVGAGRGEGFGFALLNTGRYGWTGPLNDAAEEPNFIASLGVGFDVDQNAGDVSNSSVSVHWSKTDASAGTTANPTQQFDLTTLVPPLDLAGGQWIHATITVARADNVSSLVTIVLTPQGGAAIPVATNLSVSGLVPYETRAYFAARSSGTGAEYDIANVHVHYVSDPAVLGQWGPVQVLPIIPVHSILMPSGRILCWDRSSNGLYDSAPRLLDPVLWNVTTPTDPHVEMFCSGITLRHDGKMLQAGGHLNWDDNGRNTSYIYDENTNTWTQLGNMNFGRWYPSLVNLNNGDSLVWSGDYFLDPTNPASASARNTLPQVIDGTTGVWRSLTGAVDFTNLFPMFHLAPNGQVVRTGPESDTKYLDTTDPGHWSTAIANTGQPGIRDYGNSVLYDVGKVVLIGGGSPALRSVQIIDLGAGTPQWTTVDSMSFARRQCSSLLLPDGTVLTTGGSSSPNFSDAALAVYAAELWDPTSKKWTVMAGAAVDRIYHSETILIPDGRVVSVGGGHPAADNGGTDNYDGEIYSPPYLFKGPRPTITTAPTFVAYGQVFAVSAAAGGPAITDVTLLAPNAMTHSTDMNQRILHPGFVLTAGGVTVTAPADKNLCPPGYYTIWLLASGIPSQGKMIHIGPNEPPTASAKAPGGTTVEATSGAGATVPLDASGSNDLEGTTLSYQWSEGATPLATGVNPSIPLSIGTHVITLTVTDGGGLTGTTTITITVSDTTAPAFQSLTASPFLLRSVTGGLVDVTLSATVTDAVDSSPTIQVASVTSTEPDPTGNPGDLSPDFQITPLMGLKLRAERFTYLRVYTVTVSATDASANSSSSSVQVRVRGKWFP